ncbi:MAG TPA: DUF2271 domain-containing protein [Bryobacteraceae bacterium]|nr:DUF2271 domain-containing protein [Bryobacteraceae bacterium]
MRTILSIAAAGIAASPLTYAAGIEVSVEIPRLNVAEYHRPYLAMWIEHPDQSFAANLAVWYDQQTSKSEKGTTWLKDLRQWWRKSGRDLTLPIDGISGATRPPGVHSIAFQGAKSPFAKLEPGPYQLVVEASREVGGREIVRIPFQWPATAAHPVKVKGERELGTVQLSVRP